MTRLLAVLALIAGFVVAAPVTPDHVDVTAFAATVDVSHLPSPATTRATAHPVQQGFQHQPLDGVQPPVHVGPQPRRFADVAEPRFSVDLGGRTPLGERAPPLTSGF
ncbi:MAG: hypothetical protein HOY78_41960 [Saccharothrix sp.]|nr:hypothetical protein [Saccharothrix sp.]